MSRFDIEEVLAELAVVTEQIVAEAEAADVEMNRLSAASELVLEQRVARGVPSSQPDPRHAIVDMRGTIAVRIAREYRDAAREFAAWWADVATIAVLVAVTGGSVHPVRVAAADPTIWFDDEDLQHLPEVPAHVRQLAELGARMAAVPSVSGLTDDGMADTAMRYAARESLRFDRAGDGQIVAMQDRTAEARRCRLWGEAWTEARVPALPSSDELAELLSSHSASPSAITAAIEATRAVEDAVDAHLRARELERSESSSAQEAEELEALWTRADRLTELLCHYARALTGILPGTGSRA